MKTSRISRLIITLILIITSASSTLGKPRKLIIDTDAGGDDAAAILLALAVEKKVENEDFEVIAITCTYGNTLESNVEQNVLKTLTIANRRDIPVYAGALRPLLKRTMAANYFGSDGMGDIEFNENIIGEIDRSKHASVALANLARQHAGNISVMVLGPLTNIALAISLDPNFVNNIERFYIMGSAVHGIGSVSPNVDFNFGLDPHSNFIVLNNTKGLPIMLLPRETCAGGSASMKWRINVLGAINSRAIEFLNKVERKSFWRNTWRTSDLLLSALMLWPELITRSILTNVTPVFDGAAEGSVLVDYANKTGKPQNVIIIDGFDIEGFKEKVFNAFL